VQAYAPGSPLDQLLDAPDLEGRVRMAAAAISKLHGSHVRPRATYALQNELANLEGWAADMTRLRPELADHFGRQLQGLQRRAMELHSPEPVPIHRDFYYSQLLYSEAGVTLIDLDLLALGDPAIDVANFAAHLQFLAMQRLGSPRALDRMKQVFVDHYLRLRPMPGGAAGLAFYEAATLFRLQYVALTRPAYAPYFEGLLHSLNLQVVDPLETHA
jgi:aminoglycoside phosphotransferase (APT) family kinase protein